MTRTLAPIVCLLAFACPAQGDLSASQPASAHVMLSDIDVEKLKTSRDPDTLQQIAIRVAASNDQKRIKSLASLLADKHFLDRLDPPALPDPGAYANTRLAPILQELAANNSPAAVEALLQLTRCKDFNSHTYRIQLLIHALARIDPPTAESLAYWTKYARPESTLHPDIVQALCTNHSSAALALFESLVLDPMQSPTQKESWFHTIILPRRYDTPLLVSCKKLLESKDLAADTQTLILESLFDYRPNDWYSGDDPPKPPKLESASPESRALLKSTANYALARNLTEFQKAPIAATLKSLAGSE